MKTKHSAGFTLLEIVISISVLVIVASISVPIYQSFRARNDINIAGMEIAQSVRRAEILSQAVDGDTSWGVGVQMGSITLFKGTSYADRDVDFDEVFEMPTNITPSGLSEIVFAKFTGLPEVSGTFILTLAGGETRSIIINEKGMVDY